MVSFGAPFQALTSLAGSGHRLLRRLFQMEMGDFFHWAQAIGRGAFEASHDPASQHHLPGFHLTGRNQRDLRQRSRKGGSQTTSHNSCVPSFQFGAGLARASCPIMGLGGGAQGYDPSGNTLHRYRGSSRFSIPILRHTVPCKGITSEHRLAGSRSNRPHGTSQRGHTHKEHILSATRMHEHPPDVGPVYL
jgi:hypothetical protein